MTTDPFGRLGAFVYRRRRWVLGIWVVALLACAPLAGKANGVLKAGGIEVPGSDSKRASAVLSKQFDVSALNNAAIVFHSELEEGRRPAVQGAGPGRGRPRAQGGGRHERGHVLQDAAADARQQGPAHDGRVRLDEGRRGNDAGRTSRASARPSRARRSSTTSPARRPSTATSRPRATTTSAAPR